MIAMQWNECCLSHFYCNCLPGEGLFLIKCLRSFLENTNKKNMCWPLWSHHIRIKECVALCIKLAPVGFTHLHYILRGWEDILKEKGIIIDYSNHSSRWLKQEGRKYFAFRLLQGQGDSGTRLLCSEWNDPGFTVISDKMDVFHLTCRAWWLRVLVWCLGAAVVVACCQTAGCCFWGEEVDNFNETARWCDLRGPGLGLPEVHTLPETCGPVPSLLQHKLIFMTLPTLTKRLGNLNYYHLPSLMN